jgi:hypothetical protein
LCAPVKAVRERGQVVMPPEPCGTQRWAAIVRQGPAPCAAIAPDDLRRRGRASVALSRDGTHAADTRLQFLLRVAGCFVHRLGGVVAVREVPPVRRHLGPGEGDRPAAGVLAVGDHPHNRHCQGWLHRVAQGSQVFLGGRQPAAGQEHGGGETIAQAPEDRRPDVGLEPIARQDAPARGVGVIGCRRVGSAHERATSAASRATSGRTVRGAMPT